MTSSLHRCYGSHWPWGTVFSFLCKFHLLSCALFPSFTFRRWPILKWDFSTSLSAQSFPVSFPFLPVYKAFKYNLFCPLLITLQTLTAKVGTAALSGLSRQSPNQTLVSKSSCDKEIWILSAHLMESAGLVFSLRDSTVRYVNYCGNDGRLN